MKLVKMCDCGTVNDQDATFCKKCGVRENIHNKDFRNMMYMTPKKMTEETYQALREEFNKAITVTAVKTCPRCGSTNTFGSSCFDCSSWF